MVPVNRISKINHPGVFNGFSWPSELYEFGRYNLIYGWNGTGKTTLSKLLRALEIGKYEEGTSASFKVNDNEITDVSNTQQDLRIRVFNKDFISESIFPTDGREMRPILVIGKENVQNQKSLIDVKRRISATSDELKKTQRDETDSLQALDKHCINSAKTIKDVLRSPGNNFYNSYDKSNYKKRAEELLNYETSGTGFLSDSDYYSFLSKTRSKPKLRIAELSLEFSPLSDIFEKAKGILEQSVIGKTIEEISNDDSLSNWLFQGLLLHDERESEKCLFCSQMLPKERMTSLKNHFNDEYKELLGVVISQRQVVKEELMSLETLVLPESDKIDELLHSEYAECKEALEKVVNKRKEYFERIINLLKEKEGKISQKINLQIDTEDGFFDLLKNLNKTISNHNEECEKHDAAVQEKRELLEKHLVLNRIEEYKEIKKKIQDDENNKKKIYEELKALKEKSIELESSIMEHRRPAEELNKDLLHYLGHGELQLEIRDTGYRLMRGNKPAKELSEGESTALALLYFLKSLEDQEFSLYEGVVVLDDPVSSLDSNALYLAFSFIRERTEDAGQLIILTHNFAFFRQVLNWFHHLTGQNKRNPQNRPARFYMCDCSVNNGKRCSLLRTLDPLLETYESEYDYLFSKVYKTANSPAQLDLGDCYCLPNMARRLLEAFLKFRIPAESGELSNRLKHIQFDEAKKTRILRFANSYSHASSFGDVDHEPSLLGEAKSVLLDLLELMKAEDPKHYESMVTLVKRFDRG